MGGGDFNNYFACALTMQDAYRKNYYDGLGEEHSIADLKDVPYTKSAASSENEGKLPVFNGANPFLTEELTLFQNEPNPFTEKTLINFYLPQDEAIELSFKDEAGRLIKLVRENRKAVIPQLKTKLEEDLTLLGMPSASFKITLAPTTDLTSTGMDELSFLFTANRGGSYGELKKVASGGELSRIMLVIKSILAKYEKLPTMMFDEIDTGVSGEISNRMADIMQAMSTDLQVFSITHLPQVASKGNHHFKVFKTEGAERTKTNMKKLNDDERVMELAQMLGGKALSESALAHAKQLLN